MHENGDIFRLIFRISDRDIPFGLLHVAEDVQRAAATGRSILQKRLGLLQYFGRIARRIRRSNRLKKIQQRLLVGRDPAKSGRRILHHQYHRTISTRIHILQQGTRTLNGNDQLGAIPVLDRAHHGAGVIDHNHNHLFAGQPQEATDARKRQTCQGEQEEKEQQGSCRQKQRFPKLAMKREMWLHAVEEHIGRKQDGLAIASHQKMKQNRRSCQRQQK